MTSRFSPRSSLAAVTALALLLSGLAGVLVSGSGAASEGQPILRFSASLNGDVVLAGNALLTCDAAAANCGAAQNGASFDNQDFDMVAISPSSAMLSLPLGSSVVWAGLFWGGSQPSSQERLDQATLTANGAVSDVTASSTRTAQLGSVAMYQSFADVTALVADAGSGVYALSNVALQTGNDATVGHSGGWVLSVAYARASDPLRALAVYDILGSVTASDPLAIRLDDFLVPTAGFTGKIGYAVYDGDRATEGDQLVINTVPLADTSRSATNFFTSSSTFLGSATVSRQPAYDNLLGFDIGVSDITSRLSPGQMVVTGQFQTTGDSFTPGVLTSSISTLTPKFDTTSLSVVDLNGGTVVPGDILEYTVVVTNTGNDTAVEVVLVDVLPDGVSFQPGSLLTTGGSGMAALTDASGDDAGEYLDDGRSIVVRLGTGATAEHGGQLSIGAQQTVTYRVSVNADASGAIVNDAIVSAAGQLGSPRREWLVSPATVIVDSTSTPPTPTATAVPGPVVMGVNPSVGPATGNTPVKITGSGFSMIPGETRIFFDDTLATDVACASATVCYATSPAGSDTVDIIVLVNDRASEPAPQGRFTFTGSEPDPTPTAVATSTPTPDPTPTMMPTSTPAPSPTPTATSTPTPNTPSKPPKPPKPPKPSKP
jgi:uncharacterized repeat protein (TIGR01451 family)